MNERKALQAVQLDIFQNPEDRVAELENYFTARLNKRTRVIVTRNRSHLITFRKNGTESIDLRIQEIFLGAHAPVLEAISGFIRRPSLENRRIIRKFLAEARRRRLQDGPEKPLQLITAGKHYHLDDLYEGVNREYFNGEINCRISWGRPFPKKRRRSISFGNYDAFSNLIKINPALDHLRVPEYFIRYIVFHEMLHARFEKTREPGDKAERHHSREFYLLERNFVEHGECLEWEKKNMDLFFK